jgi:phosphatidylserine/phosphatidylglycerophosphate/cardiolipin synthase-like enzyme
MPKFPATPLGETGCFDLYVQAIRNAEQYIYIEDQYFRSDRIAQELAKACRKNPKLILVVITRPDYIAWSEEKQLGLATPSTFWTADSFKIIAAAMPGFTLFYLQVSDTDAGGQWALLEVNTPAKIKIVDDEWYMIGSCNINERGFIYEGELNAGVHEPTQAFALRKRLWSEHLQEACPDDIGEATRLWFDHAAENHKAQKDRKKPRSRVFPFTQQGPALPVVPKTWF